MLLMMPVQDAHEWTRETVDALGRVTARSNAPSDVRLVIFDNASVEPYSIGEFSQLARQVLDIGVVRSHQNLGFYRPLEAAVQLAEGDELVGICHNDVFLYEPGWNERMYAAFDADLQLGLVGLCGSDEADAAGGRGGGTMCFFRGEKGQSQTAGLRIHDVHPSMFLDSLFMMFRAPAISCLQENWADLPLAHFYDKIWPLQLWANGWRTATMGIECDHAGGITIVANQRYAADCKRWFDERVEHALHIDTRCHSADGVINYELAMYLHAEERLLRVWRDQKKFIPCWVDGNWTIHKGHK